MGDKTATIKSLLIINITVHLAKFLMGPGGEELLYRWFGLVPVKALQQVHLWQFVSYMFLHGNLWHLFFNMFALWMFGSEIESLWGRRVFLQYYFFCGLGGGLIYALTALNSPIPLVGASGAVFGILLAYGLMFPERKILLYFIFPIKAKYFVLIFGIFELLAAQQGRMDGIGHYAHLGGMLFGYIYLVGGVGRRLRGRGLGDLRGWWRRRQTKSRIRIVRPDGESSGSSVSQEKIDEILEKISREGLNSLTAEEQDILRRASRKH
jgi:membrane associated rhomboid family serine protease